jgi:hypothetical protein
MAVSKWLILMVSPLFCVMTLCPQGKALRLCIITDDCKIISEGYCINICEDIVINTQKCRYLASLVVIALGS